MIQNKAVSIKQQALRSLRWTTVGEVASKSIQPVVTLILARVLTPAEFGIVGVAMIAIGFGQIFQDFGLGKTLIQLENKLEESSNIIFWTNIALSFFLYILIFASSPYIAVFFKESAAINVLRILSIQLIFTSSVSVHTSLLQRSFDYKKLILIRLSTSLIPGLLSIPLAYAGYGVWALVIGSLFSSLAQSLLLWHYSSWRPSFKYDLHQAKILLGFGRWVLLEAFLGWLLIWGDSIVLGHFLGVKELGIYRVSVTFLLLIYGTFFNPLLPVAYSAFSRLQSDISKLRDSLVSIIHIVALISIPIGIGLASLSPQISTLFFNSQWKGVSFIIAILGIKDAITWLVGFNAEAYRAIGKPDINSKLLFIATIFYIPVYYFIAPYGIYVFCWARLLLAVASIFLHIYFSKTTLGLPFNYLFSCVKFPLIGGIIMGITIYFLTDSFNFTPLLLELIILSGVGFIIYFLTLKFLSNNTLNQFLRLVKESAK